MRALGEDIFPKTFREFCSSCMQTQALLHKRLDQSRVPFLDRKPYIAYTFEKRTPSFELKDESQVFGFYSVYGEIGHSLYRRAITQGSPEAKLLGNLRNLEGQENRIPRLERLSNIPLNSDETRAVFSLKSAPNMQIDSCLDYFRNHLDTFDNKDWALIFHSILFDGHLLLNELGNERGRKLILPKIKEFFLQVIKTKFAERKVHVAANLLWLLSQVQQQVDFVAKNRNLFLNLAKLFFSSTRASAFMMFHSGGVYLKLSLQALLHC